MDGISPAAAAYYNSLGVQKNTDWLASTESAIKNSQNQAGIMGALASSASGNRGSISSFLSQNKSFANNFATITTTSTTNYGKYYAQLASANQKQAAQEKLKKALEALSSTQNQVKKKNVLSPTIFLGNGTTINTSKGIMTMKDGTQIDITTGAKIVNTADLIQMGNGSYLNTQTNILTLTDGTQIDTVTGLKVDTSA